MRVSLMGARIVLLQSCAPSSPELDAGVVKAGCWMQEAEADRQKTFLRLALNAAAKLPWTLPLMRSGTFLQVVTRLQKNQCAPHAGASALLTYAEDTLRGARMRVCCLAVRWQSLRHTHVAFVPPTSNDLPPMPVLLFFKHERWR